MRTISCILMIILAVVEIIFGIRICDYVQHIDPINFHFYIFFIIPNSILLSLVLIIVTFTKQKSSNKYSNKKGIIWLIILFIPKEILPVLSSLILSVPFSYVYGIIISNIIMLIIAILYKIKYNNNKNSGDENVLNQETKKEIKGFYWRAISFFIMTILLIVEEFLDFKGATSYDLKYDNDTMTAPLGLLFVAGPSIILSIIILFTTIRNLKLSSKTRYYVWLVILVSIKVILLIFFLSIPSSKVIIGGIIICNIIFISIALLYKITYFNFYHDLFLEQ